MLPLNITHYDTGEFPDICRNAHISNVVSLQENMDKYCPLYKFMLNLWQNVRKIDLHCIK